MREREEKKFDGDCESTTCLVTSVNRKHMSACTPTETAQHNDGSGLNHQQKVLQQST